MALVDVNSRTPAQFVPIVERLAGDAAARFGDVRLTAEAYEDRPYSHLLVIRVDFAAAQRPPAHLFVKLFKATPAQKETLPRRIADDFAVTRAVHDHLAQWSGLSAVEPLVCYPDLLAIVTVRADGRMLLDVVRDKAAWFPGARTRRELVTTMEAVGRWIRVFQTFRPGSATVSVDALREYVDVRLKRLADARVIGADDRQRLLRRLGGLGREIPAADLREVTLHGDLAPSNVLVSGDKVVVIDFAMTTRGSFLHDITRLALQLEQLGNKPLFRKAILDELLAAMYHGFDAGLDMRHPLLRFSTILHRVNHFATLTLRPEKFPSSLLSRKTRAAHWRALRAEMDATAT